MTGAQSQYGKSQRWGEVRWRRERTCCNLVEGDGLSSSPAQGHAHPLKQLLFGEQVLVAREDLSKSQGCIGPRGNGYLANTTTQSICDLHVPIVSLFWNKYWLKIIFRAFTSQANITVLYNIYFTSSYQFNNNLRINLSVKSSCTDMIECTKRHLTSVVYISPLTCTQLEPSIAPVLYQLSPLAGMPPSFRTDAVFRTISAKS